MAKRLHRYTTLRGINLIKGFERLRLTPYDDGYGYATWGYGHLIKEGEVFGATKEEAEEVLRKDLYKAECSVVRNITIPLRDCEFDALVSFAFNAGGGALQSSTLRMRLNRDSDRENVAQEFKKWNKVKGCVSRGLVRRREAERLLFLSGY